MIRRTSTTHIRGAKEVWQDDKKEATTQNEELKKVWQDDKNNANHS